MADPCRVSGLHVDAWGKSKHDGSDPVCTYCTYVPSVCMNSYTILKLARLDYAGYVRKTSGLHASAAVGQKPPLRPLGGCHPVEKLQAREVTEVQSSRRELLPSPGELGGGKIYE